MSIQYRGDVRKSVTSSFIRQSVLAVLPQPLPHWEIRLGMPYAKCYKIVYQVVEVLGGKSGCIVAFDHMLLNELHPRSPIRLSRLTSLLACQIAHKVCYSLV